MTRSAWVALGLLGALFEPGTGYAEPPTAASADAVESPELVAARAANLAAYEAARAALVRDASGQWIVITGGKVTKGPSLESLEDVLKRSSQAAHRFVFRAGEEGDREGDANAWYGARFAGLSLAGALGAAYSDAGDGIELSRGDERASFKSISPFPRIRVDINAPDGTPPSPGWTKLPEVFLGTVGPPLVLTPRDAIRLHLERWEVPGTLHALRGGIPCRRALVRVSVPGLSRNATIVAAIPTVSHDALVDQSRWRHHFWSWGAGGPISRMAFRDVPEGSWVVFGNDRVLGHGKSPEEAVTAADVETEFAYHRFLLRWPQELPQALIPVGGERDKPRVFDLTGATKVTPQLNGRRVEALALVGDIPTFVVTSNDAAAIGLEMAEAPYDARIVEGEGAQARVRYARAGMAWMALPTAAGATAGTQRRLVLVAYERLKIPGLDEAVPALPGKEAPGKEAPGKEVPGKEKPGTAAPGMQ